MERLCKLIAFLFPTPEFGLCHWDFAEKAGIKVLVLERWQELGENY